MSVFDTVTDSKGKICKREFVITAASCVCYDERCNI